MKAVVSAAAAAAAVFSASLSHGQTCEGDVCDASSVLPASRAAPAETFVGQSAVDDVYVLDVTLCEDCNFSQAGRGCEACADENGTLLVSPYEDARKFYTQNADDYDVLVLWSQFRSGLGGLGPIYMWASNDVRGINFQGRHARNVSETPTNAGLFGSGGRIKGVIDMKQTHNCKAGTLLGGMYRCSEEPPYPESDFSVVNTLAQEVGHRFGAYVRLGGIPGVESNALLGREGTHWSYALDTGGSPMDGQRWAYVAPGDFYRLPIGRVHYSPLDQYLMGLRAATDVPRFMLIGNSVPRLDGSTPPNSDAVAVRGAPVWVAIDNVIEANGVREPPYERAPKVERQAWLFLFDDKQGPDPEQIAAVARLRRAWNDVYYKATEGRGRVVTSLSGVDELPIWLFQTNADVAREGIHGGWKAEDSPMMLAGGELVLTGSSPRIAHDSVRIDADLRTAFEVEVAVAEEARGPAYLEWKRSGDAAQYSVAFDVVADGRMRAYAVWLPSEHWRGIITELALSFPAVPTETQPTARLGMLRFLEALDDRDGDGIVDRSDVCPDLHDPRQADQDADGLGDSCDEDSDGDNIEEEVDNCPGLRSVNTSDADGDGIGDACDDTPFPPLEAALGVRVRAAEPTTPGCATAGGNAIAFLTALTLLPLRRRAVAIRRSVLGLVSTALVAVGCSSSREPEATNAPPSVRAQSAAEFRVQPAPGSYREPLVLTLSSEPRVRAEWSLFEPSGELIGVEAGWLPALVAIEQSVTLVVRQADETAVGAAVELSYQIENVPTSDEGKPAVGAIEGVVYLSESLLGRAIEVRVEPGGGSTLLRSDATAVPYRIGAVRPGSFRMLARVDMNGNGFDLADPHGISLNETQVVAGSVAIGADVAVGQNGIFAGVVRLSRPVNIDTVRLTAWSGRGPGGFGTPEFETSISYGGETAVHYGLENVPWGDYGIDVELQSGLEPHSRPRTRVRKPRVLARLESSYTPLDLTFGDSVMTGTIRATGASSGRAHIDAALQVIPRDPGATSASLDIALFVDGEDMVGNFLIQALEPGHYDLSIIADTDPNGSESDRHLLETIEIPRGETDYHFTL